MIPGINVSDKVISIEINVFSVSDENEIVKGKTTMLNWQLLKLISDVERRLEKVTRSVCFFIDSFCLSPQNPLK